MRTKLIFSRFILNKCCLAVISPIPVELHLIFQDEEVSGQFLFLILLGIKLVDSGSEVGGISSESDTHKSQELVHTRNQVLRAVGNTVSTGSTFVNDNPI